MSNDLDELELIREAKSYAARLGRAGIVALVPAESSVEPPPFKDEAAWAGVKAPAKMQLAPMRPKPATPPEIAEEEEPEEEPLLNESEEGDIVVPDAPDPDAKKEVSPEIEPERAKALAEQAAREEAEAVEDEGSDTQEVAEDKGQLDLFG